MYVTNAWSYFHETNLWHIIYTDRLEPWYGGTYSMIRNLCIRIKRRKNHVNFVHLHIIVCFINKHSLPRPARPPINTISNKNNNCRLSPKFYLTKTQADSGHDIMLAFLQIFVRQVTVATRTGTRTMRGQKRSARKRIKQVNECCWHN